MRRNYGPTIRVQKIAESKGCNQVLWLFGDNHEVREPCALGNCSITWRSFCLFSSRKSEPWTFLCTGSMRTEVSAARVVQRGRCWKCGRVSWSCVCVLIVWVLLLAEPEIATPPLTGIILPGVTRKSLLELGATWVCNIAVFDRAVTSQSYSVLISIMLVHKRFMKYCLLLPVHKV